MLTLYYIVLHCSYISLCHLDSGDLLAVSVDHGEVSKEMSPLPVDWVLEAWVVGIQVCPVHQDLLTVVQVSDGFRKRNHVLEVAGCRPDVVRLRVSGSQVYPT